MPTTYLIPITWLRYYDFKDNLDELFELAPGKRMSISIEHDNPLENDAVIVYYLDKCVGYVRSGKDRETAYSLIRNSGKDSLLGKIVRIDKRKNWLLMEITTSQTITPCTNNQNLLSEWKYSGKLLPVDRNIEKLNAMLSNLEQVVEQTEPWDDEMESWLNYICHNLWRDISVEAYNKLIRVIDLLMAGSQTISEYEIAADMLQCAIDDMGTAEIRQLQISQIKSYAHSQEMDILLMHRPESEIESDIHELPSELRSLFIKDEERCVGRLWYMRLKSEQIRAIYTLLSMLIRQKENVRNELDERYFTKESLLSWASQHKDSQRAALVAEFLSCCEIKRTNPTLSAQMENMMESCNPAKQTEKNVHEMSKAIGKQHVKNNISQLVIGSGYQQLAADAT